VCKNNLNSPIRAPLAPQACQAWGEVPHSRKWNWPSGSLCKHKSLSFSAFTSRSREGLPRATNNQALEALPTSKARVVCIGRQFLLGTLTHTPALPRLACSAQPGSARAHFSRVCRSGIPFQRIAFRKGPKGTEFGSRNPTPRVDHKNGLAGSPPLVGLTASGDP